MGTLQLLDQRSDYEEEAANLFQKYDNDKRNQISVADQLALFITLAHSFTVVTVVIDALDECKKLDDFVQGLEHLIRHADVTIHMLITGRNEYSLEASVGALATYHISLEQNIGNDIDAFIKYEVNRRIEMQKLKVRSQELKGLIIHSLSRQAEGM